MTSKKVYLLTLGAVLLASIYPLYMGAAMVSSYWQNGGIDAADYPSYVIPYTPICVAVIACVMLLPLAFRWCKKFTLPALSGLGVLLFLVVEMGFEQMAVFTEVSATMRLETWQLYMCAVTPPVKEVVWDSLNIRYNPAFKMHFYTIAILIVLAVTGVAYGFYKMAHTQDFTGRKPLAAQLGVTVVFIGLCILACFTAFFRTGDIVVSPLSAVLMTAFFLIFGITAGVYTGTWLYGKARWISLFIPSVVAMVFVVVMYIGEMVMMGGGLFLLGRGFLFEPLGALPLSPVDVMTVLLSGAATYMILKAIRAK